jgi:hypothetical protein
MPEDEFTTMYRAMRRDERWWVTRCRLRSLASRCKPSPRALLMVGWCGVFFGGPFPPSPDLLIPPAERDAPG